MFGFGFVFFFFFFYTIHEIVAPALARGEGHFLKDNMECEDGGYSLSLENNQTDRS